MYVRPQFFIPRRIMHTYLFIYLAAKIGREIFMRNTIKILAQYK